MHEHEIINTFFNQPITCPQVHLGVGDDAALMTLPLGYELAISIDTLIAGVHFPIQTSPYDIGYKALAVSLSDMAAMGAEPLTVLLSLTLPHAQSPWLTEFARGFFDLAHTYHVDLIGGDTNRGPLSITTVVHGKVPRSHALRRAGAAIDDDIYVTGTLGDAGLALQQLQSNLADIQPVLLQRLNRPQPRVEAGIALRTIATAAIDISDGLATDLNKILHRSGIGGIVYADLLPLSSTLKQHCASNSQAWQLALTAGDDYELCFTAPANHRAALEKVATLVPIQRIGKINAGTELHIFNPQGQEVPLQTGGYQHF